MRAAHPPAILRALLAAAALLTFAACPEEPIEPGLDASVRPDAAEPGLDASAEPGPDAASPGPDAATWPPECTNGTQDGDETDVDCGGGSCARCGFDRHCTGDIDCESGVCGPEGTCIACSLPVDCGPDEACRVRTCSGGICGFYNLPETTNCGSTKTCDGEGRCRGCTTASDCPGQDTECATRTCVNTFCGLSFAANGTAVSAQDVGDCRKTVCDGAGGTRVVVDDGDVPVDGNPCTEDLCTDGVPSHPAVVGGTPCAGGVCDGSGQCVGCLLPGDCPGTDTECRVRTCVDQVCGFSDTAQGTPLVNGQVAGDCRELRCDGSGGVTNAEQETDVPVDGNDCTSDLCQAGNPVNASLPAGTACGTGGVCDGHGHCGECVTKDTCPGVDTECRVRTCIDGACGFSDTAAGTPLAQQVAEDCHQVQCDGSGGTVNAVFDEDVNDDDNPCTDDVCTDGVPSNPLLPAGTSCGAALVCDDQGQCLGCTSPSDCAGTDTECHQRTCVDGVCGVSYAAAGTPLTEGQTAGDCRQLQCDGSGGEVSVEDDSDVPVDGNDCTDDVCTAGIPTNPPLPASTACAAGVCNGLGACVACLAPSDCSGTDTECRVRACTDGVCGFTDTAAGTPIAAQMPGDCHEVQCDGAGGTVDAVHDADVPADDGNQCTAEACADGVPGHPFVPAGDACNQNGGSVCDAAGNCVQCLVATTCSGADTECQTRTCNDGVCGMAYTPAGTPLATQTAGDCQQVVCDGAGATASQDDDTDVPADDGNQCTDEVCSAGSPGHPYLPLGTACNQNGGIQCDGNGACVACSAPDDCPGTDTDCQTRTCTDGACGFDYAPAGTPVTSQTAGDCQRNQCDGSGGVVSVPDDTDLPVDGNPCTDDVCTGGTPSNPASPAGTACGQGGGAVCDGNGQCVGCVSASDCLGSDTECQTRTCTSGVCGYEYTPAGTPVASQTAGDCKAHVCDGAGNVVAAPDDADLPVDGNECTDDVCTAGEPSNPPSPLGTSCSQDGGSMCDAAGHCVGCVAPSDCPGADSDCQTRSCNGGVCGFSFTPAGTPVGTQTAGDCQRDECDGAGSVVSVADDSDIPADDGNVCTDEVCASGVPDHPAKPLGSPCGDGMACDNAGACVAVPEVASTSPADAAIGVPATTSIAVTFNTAMDPATLTAQTASGACSGSIQVSHDDFATCQGFASATAVMSAGNTVATFVPAPGLLVNRTYKVRVTTAAARATGLALAADFTHLTGFATVVPVACGAGGVVISQVYGGGGGSSPVPTYKNDFIELHNRGTTAVDLTGMSIQYGSATGTGNWANVLALNGTIEPGNYFLIQMGGGSAGADLPAPDQTGNANMAAGSGRVALVTGTGLLSGACPDPTRVVDFVGYGTVNCSEGSAAGTLTSLLSASRKAGGCQDDNVNSSDFSVGTPMPRNSSSPSTSCACAQNESDAPLEADYCATHWPLSLTVQTGTAVPTVYGRIYEAGVTETPGASASVTAELGWGPVTVNPEYEYGWTWVPATYNVQQGNDDEYQASFTAPAVGTYRYGFRFSLDGGASWTYCDNLQGDHGAGANPGLALDLADMGIMEVTP